MSNYKKFILETITDCILAESEAKVDFLIKNKKVETTLKNAIEKDPEIENKDITPKELLLSWDRKSPSLSKNIIWLTKQYSQGLFHNGDINRLENDLVKFEKYKRNKDLFDSSDLNKYDYSELKQKLDQINDEDISNLGSSARKNAVEKGKDEIEKIYENDKWLIISPKTEAASRYWGKNTRWCTAADSEYNMFDSYNKSGPLYILINKNNPEEKYQFHFKSKQFMDKNDQYMDLKNFLKDNPEIKTVFRDKADKTDIRYWPFLNEDDITYTDCLNAVKNDCWNSLKVIPDKYKTKEIYEIAVSKNINVLPYVPNEFKDYDFYLNLTKNKKGFSLPLNYIPDEFKDLTICKNSIVNSPCAKNIEALPEQFKTLEFFRDVAKDTEYLTRLIKDMPNEFKTAWFFKEIIDDINQSYIKHKMQKDESSNSWNKRFLHKVLPKQELDDKYIRFLNEIDQLFKSGGYKDGHLVKIEYDRDAINKLIKDILTKNGNLIRYLPRDFINYDFAVMAVQHSDKIKQELESDEDSFIDITLPLKYFGEIKYRLQNNIPLIAPKELSGEKWREIPDCPGFQVSNKGRIKSRAYTTLGIDNEVPDRIWSADTSDTATVFNSKTKQVETINILETMQKVFNKSTKYKKESTMAYVIKITDLTGEGKPDLYYAEPRDMRRALVADINQAKRYATEEEAYNEIDDSDVAELVIDYGYYNWESDEDGNVDFVDEVPGDAIDIVTESKSLKDIRNKMNKLVESLNEAGTDYDQVLELCYADWGDWDGHDDSTEPEQPNYICYYLYDVGVGGFTDSADFPEIYHKLETKYIKHPNVLTQDKTHALKFAIFDLSYDDEMNFCQNIADIFNEAKFMGREDWAANFKDL